MALSRDDILKAPGPGLEIVQVPEWGGEVAVKGMSGAERDAFEFQSLRPDGFPRPENVRARIVAWCAVDEDTGERLFSDADAQALGEKSAAAVTRVADVAMRLSGLVAEDVKELEENFGGPRTAGTAPGGASSSASPGTSARAPKNSSPRSAAGN